MNNINDVDGFVIKCLREGFIIKKWGNIPPFKQNDIKSEESTHSNQIDVKLEHIKQTPKKKDIYGE
jgi:hypothetical protein